jgi:hypothetical protein
MELPKPEDTFRMYGMNPNGFRLDQKGGDITEFFGMASSIQADFVGCAEHNLDFTQQTTLKRYGQPHPPPSNTPINQEAL